MQKGLISTNRKRFGRPLKSLSKGHQIPEIIHLTPAPSYTPSQPSVSPTDPNTNVTPSTTRYILNTNTKKFHYPDCRGVSQMNEWNKLPSSASREDIIAQGYSPCGICKP